MTKTASALLVLLLVAACDTRTPRSDPTPMPLTGFDNSAAAQSIMQPKVIAASKPEPTPTPVAAPPKGATILFERGATLDDQARATLDGLLAAPALPLGARWVLRGSSDNDGANAANLRVSRRRGEAVRDYLVAQKVEPALITVIALGAGRPVAPNVKLDGSDDPEGRRRNRRVDVEIVLPPATETLPAPEASPPEPLANARD